MDAAVSCLQGTGRPKPVRLRARGLGVTPGCLKQCGGAINDPPMVEPESTRCGPARAASEIQRFLLFAPLKELARPIGCHPNNSFV